MVKKKHERRSSTPPSTYLSHRRYLWKLMYCFAALWVVLAISPLYRGDWLVENLLVIVFIAGLIAYRRVLFFSRISYTFIFVFLTFHTIGSHYTYAETPYDAWLQAITGRTLNSLLGWERNNYDRIVHFLYGLLLAYPVREVFLRVANVQGFWGYFLPLDLTMSSSAFYELIEWGAALALGGDLGAAYLGTQGDIWDAHKDMALASLGALIAMSVTAWINFRSNSHFTSECIESLRAKNHEPLGEDALRR